jgi:hypothetical protein
MPYAYIKEVLSSDEYRTPPRFAISRTLLLGVISTLAVGLKQILHGLVAFSATFRWYHVFSKGAFDMAEGVNWRCLT